MIDTGEKRRLESTEEFRRKKRNLLAISALGIGIGISNLPLSIKLPGLSDASIVSFYFILGLLLYSAYAFIEFIHEFLHIRRENGVWKSKFESDGDLLKTVKNLKKSIEDNFPILNNLATRNNALSYEQLSSIRAARDRLQGAAPVYDRMSFGDNAPPQSAEWRNFVNGIGQDFTRCVVEIDKFIETVGEAEQIGSSGESDTRGDLMMIEMRLQEIIDRNLLPSAKEATKISFDIYKSDGNMLKYHDGFAPISIFCISTVTLLIKAIGHLPMNVL